MHAFCGGKKSHEYIMEIYHALENGGKRTISSLNLLQRALNLSNIKVIKPNPLWTTVSMNIPDPHHMQDALAQETASCAVCTLVVSCSLLH